MVRGDPGLLLATALPSGRSCPSLPDRPALPPLCGPALVLWLSVLSGLALSAGLSLPRGHILTGWPSLPDVGLFPPRGLALLCRPAGLVSSLCSSGTLSRGLAPLPWVSLLCAFTCRVLSSVNALLCLPSV